MDVGEVGCPSCQQSLMGHKESAMKRNPNWTREEEILVLDYYFRIFHEGENARELTQEASDILRKMPNARNATNPASFRSYNGVNMKLANFRSLDPTYDGAGLTNAGRSTIAIWNEFSQNRKELSRQAARIRSSSIDPRPSCYEEGWAILDDSQALDLETEAGWAAEGTARKILTTRYERNPQNRAAIESHGPSCQICGFDFEEAYGPLGQGFIEVHHKTPLHFLDEEVKINPIEDLTCVCSNCHRMLHRKKYTPLDAEDLRNIVKAQRGIG